MSRRGVSVNRRKLAEDFIRALCEKAAQKDAIEVSVNQLVLVLNVNKHIVYEVLAYLESRGWARKVKRGTWKILLWKYRSENEEEFNREKSLCKRMAIEVVRTMRGSCSKEMLISAVQYTINVSRKIVKAAINELIREGYLRELEGGKYVELTSKCYEG